MPYKRVQLLYIVIGICDESESIRINLQLLYIIIQQITQSANILPVQKQHTSLLRIIPIAFKTEITVLSDMNALSQYGIIIRPHYLRQFQYISTFTAENNTTFSLRITYWSQLTLITTEDTLHIQSSTNITNHCEILLVDHTRLIYDYDRIPVQFVLTQSVYLLLAVISVALHISLYIYTKQRMQCIYLRLYLALQYSRSPMCRRSKEYLVKTTCVRILVPHITQTNTLHYARLSTASNTRNSQ